MQFLKDIFEHIMIFTNLQRNFQKKFEPLYPHGFLAILMYVWNELVAPRTFKIIENGL
jgi:hypothetical protein